MTISKNPVHRKINHHSAMASAWPVLLLILAFLVAAPAYSQEPRIGFVNAGKVLEQAPQADAAGRMLREEFAPREQAIVKQQQELRAMEEKITRDGAVMSEPERRKLEREIINYKRDIKRSQDEFQEDLNIRRNESFEKLRKLVREVVVDIAKTEKFDLIVSDGVVYASQRVDITNKVVERLAQEYKKSPSASSNK